MQFFVVREVLEHCELNKSPEGVLKAKIEHNARGHDTDNITKAELENLIELDKEAIWQRAVDELYHEGSDKGRLEGKLAKHAEDGTAHKSLAKGEPAAPEDNQDHVDTQGVRRPRQSEIRRVFFHVPAVGRCNSRVTDEKIGEHECESDQEHYDLADSTVMNVVYDGMFCFALLLL